MTVRELVEEGATVNKTRVSILACLAWLYIMY